MTFLNPLFLLGLLGMAVPLVIHLLSRRTARRQDFSSLEFLRNLERKSMRRVRVRQWLLLLTRMGIIAAVALAMARPTLTGVSAGGGRGSTSAAIVLDGSFSMRGRCDDGALFDEAKETALQILATLERGDEVLLLVPGADGGSRPEGIRDLALARERIAIARPGLAAVSLPAAIRRAARALESARHLHREIHVVSDFQRGAWESESEGPELLDGTGLFLYPVRGDAPPPNAWVESVDFSGQILEKGSPIEFRSVVAAGPGFGPREVEVEMEIDGVVVDRRRIDLAPASRLALTFRETFAEDGLHLGSIVVRSGSGLADDDRRSFTLRTARSVPVTLVAGDDAARRYLEAALAPRGAAVGGFAVRHGEPGSLTNLSPDREAVVVVADVDRLSEEELGGLKSFLSDGGGVLVVPGPRTDAAAWGRSFLPRFLPGTLAEGGTDPNALRISELDPTHPLFDLFRGGEGGLTEVRFTRHLRFVPRPGTSVLASFSNGDAALVESSLLPGRVLFLTSALDAAWSDLPLTGAFLPLVHEAVRYLSERAAKTTREVTVGEGTVVRLSRVPEGGALTLLSPEGAERAAGVVPDPGGYAVELPVADRPGFWVFVSGGGDTLAAVAANVPGRESDPTRIPAAELERRRGPGRGAVLSEGTGLTRHVREARVGREIGRWFLWVAAVLLAVEMGLASRFRRTPEEATA
jgi:hypothetical protein